MFLAAMLAVAHGQSWQTEQQGVLVATPGTVTENGIGSPSVVWDPNIDRYVMFFETQAGAATADCPVGTWGIGAAVSDDGLAWEVWPELVIAPTAGTPWRCVAAHPSVTLDGETYHLYFKSEQGVNACGAGNLAWGCGSYSGVGHAVVDVELDDKTADIALVEAEIVSVQAERDAAMDAFATSLADYDALLDASLSEFACDDEAPVCVPCGTIALASSRSGNGSYDFCQDYAFQIPASMPVSGGIGNAHEFTLEIDLAGGGTKSCVYTKNGGTLYLKQNKCTDGTVAGTEVTATAVRLNYTKQGAGNNIQANLSLTATNLGDQGYSGELLDQIDDLFLLVDANDFDGTEALLPDFLAELDGLLGWLAPYTPADAGKTTLESEGAALATEGETLLANLGLWREELAALEAELEALRAYTQHVVPTTDSGVALPIGTVLGYPTVFHDRSAGVWVMLVQKYPDIWRATATSPSGPFTLDAAPAIQKGTVSWAQTELFEPNAVCTGDPVFPYQAYVAGRTFSGRTFVSGGISDALSSNMVTWLLNTTTQYFGWTNLGEYRHFDVVRNSAGAYRMWYAERDAGGKNMISVATTDLAYDDASTGQRICP